MLNMGFLASPGDCLVCSTIATDSAVLDAHELACLRAGALFRYYGHSNCEIMIGSVTTRGYLTTVIHQNGAIEHAWDYDN